MDQINFPVIRLFLAHVFIIVVSNYAVQLPVTIMGIESTWGTFTYPFIFLTTDLTVRIFGARKARAVIFFAMIPALILSYIFGTIFEHGDYQGIGAITVFSIFIFRIALASFSGYVVGQIMDIFVFSRLRKLRQWYAAPAASSIVGNLIDTLVFYSIAFYKCQDEYLAANWFALGTVDYMVKLITSVALFVPIYGVLLAFLAKYVLKRPLSGIGVA